MNQLSIEPWLEAISMSLYGVCEQPRGRWEVLVGVARIVLRRITPF